MSTEKKRYIFFGIIAVLVLSTIIAVVCLINNMLQYKKAKEEYTAIEEQVVTPPSTVPKKTVTLYSGTATTEVVTNKNPDAPEVSTQVTPDMDINFYELLKTNPDCVGWIYVPNTNINYPVVQSKDNIDYVRKTFNGTDNIAGCIFSDCRIVSPFSQKTILYGHNMKNGTMFHDLFEIEKDPDKFDIWIYLQGGTLYHYYVEDVKRTVKTDSEVYSISSTYDDTLVLSTCIKNDTRLVVIAKRDWYQF